MKTGKRAGREDRQEQSRDAAATRRLGPKWEPGAGRPHAIPTQQNPHSLMIPAWRGGGGGAADPKDSIEYLPQSTAPHQTRPAKPAATRTPRGHPATHPGQACPMPETSGSSPGPCAPAPTLARRQTGEDSKFWSGDLPARQSDRPIASLGMNWRRRRTRLRGYG